MKNLTALLTVLAVLMCVFPAVAVEKLYFGDMGENKVIRCNLNGSSREDLVTTDIEAIGSIAIDRLHGKMYWTDWPAVTAHIKRANLDGSNVETVLSGLQGPYGIDLDVAAGKMYWTEFSAGKIRRANLDGSGVEDLVTMGLSHVGDIVLDVDGGKMYWGDGTTEYSAKIQRANLDGTNVETLVTDPLVAPAGIALDAADDRVYWADLGAGKYYRCFRDGTGLEELLSSTLDIPVGMAVNPAEGKIYLSEYDSISQIKKANTDGTSLQTIIYSGIGAVYALELGPDVGECVDTTLDGPWLVVVSGIAPYDYSVWLTFDGVGNIPLMGSFNVPDPAGFYAVGQDCTLTGELWTDAYVPFTGEVFSPNLAEMDIGSGPMPLLKVTDPGALEGCWQGAFVMEPTGAGWNVVLEVDATGSVTYSFGFPADVTGKMFTATDGIDTYLAGYLVIESAPEEQIVFQEIFTASDVLLEGAFARDCGTECDGGVFELHNPCMGTGVGDEIPGHSSAGLRNYPNPFNPLTRVAFHLDHSTAVSLQVFDASGRRVCTLLDGNILPAGSREVVWNGQNDHGEAMPSGVYFYRLDAGSGVVTNRMTLLR